MGDEAAAAALAPGFRFHPTDEELVSYYLKRKVCGKPFRFYAISVVDLYKTEPWDLPGLSRLKSKDLEWYFFGALDQKNGNSSRTNRATEQGYWKTTGKDRQVRRYNRIVGMKKTSDLQWRSMVKLRRWDGEESPKLLSGTKVECSEPFVSI